MTFNTELWNGQAPEAGGYAIERSLRFNSSDSAYLSRTPASAGNRRTWTWAGWVKRSKLGADQQIWYVTTTGSPQLTDYIRFEPDDTFRFFTYNNSVGSFVWQLYTSAKFRDPSSWYHIVCSVDTTQSTASDRVKLYINGSEVTDFSTSTYPSQNYDTNTNNTVSHNIGAYNANASFFSGYLADVHFIDGQALDPTSFGEFDANGIWQPIAYSGSYGTNGFHLPFSDNSSAAALGYDAAGSNDWTVNNISVTAGAGNDSLVDVPTNGTETDSGLGAQVRGNYATLNPLDRPSTTTISNGNLEWTAPSGSTYGSGAISTIGISSGKYYWELLVGTTGINSWVGLYREGFTPTGSWLAGGFLGYRINTGGSSSTIGGSGSFSAPASTGDILGIAVDLTNGTFSVYKNGIYLGALTGLSFDGSTWFPGSNTNFAVTTPYIFNFGQRPFAYTAPSGFKALCTTNLPAPLVAKPSTAMDVVKYDGTGSTQTISGLGFSPDLLWIKSRNATYSHRLFDTIRGVSDALYSNLTDVEGTYQGTSENLTAFTSDGFSLGSTSGTNGINQSTTTYVAWTWDAGSSTVSNTDGSITSQVRANPTAGFSIVTYTGTFAVDTVGHGLNDTPKIIIIKRRDATSDWVVYTTAIDGTLDYLYLNLTNTKADASVGESLPTSTTFGLGAGGNSNPSGGYMVAYCFAPVDGYSSFGSYTGNGSADGPFVYTGFRPRFVLFKCTSDSNSWQILDTARDTFNEATKGLFPNLSNAEISNGAYDLDMLSNGIKIRTSDQYFNGSGKTFLIAAFAENPFKTARAR